MTSQTHPQEVPELVGRRCHHIKCWPEVFDEMKSGRKTAEFRLNDRDYRTGDDLLIREWCPEAKSYTHREISRRITHVLADGFGIPAGYAMLSLAALTKAAPPVEGDLREALINAVYALEYWERESRVWLSARAENAKPGWMRGTRERGQYEIARGKEVLQQSRSTPMAAPPDALAALSSAPVAPEGFVLVPRKPTGAMKAAMGIFGSEADLVWQDLLAASPVPVDAGVALGEHSDRVAVDTLSAAMQECRRARDETKFSADVPEGERRALRNGAEACWAMLNCMQGEILKGYGIRLPERLAALHAAPAAEPDHIGGVWMPGPDEAPAAGEKRDAD